jgi:hypothetical protein
MSVAVATPKGLVTPVVRNVESMEMVEIEQEIAKLGKKACPYSSSDFWHTNNFRHAMASSRLRTWQAAPTLSVTAVSSAA